MTTNREIRQLEITAGENGDFLQAAICQIALYGEINERTAERMMPSDLDAARRYGSKAAWAECERVLREAKQ